MTEVRNVIVHGDSRLLAPKIRTPINCIITDPPYGMAFTSKMATEPESRARFNQKIEADHDIEAALELFNEVMHALIPKLAEVAEVYVFTAWHILDRWMPAVKALPDLTLKQMLVWDKGYPGLGDLDCNWGCGHEIILYLKKGRRPIPERRVGILHYDKIPAGKNTHPTQKPVPLLEKLITMSTDPGDLIVDPFSGSGSTSVAAKNMGRNSLAFEIDEKWVGMSQEFLKLESLLV